jgi:neutral ceramidase
MNKKNFKFQYRHYIFLIVVLAGTPSFIAKSSPDIQEGNQQEKTFRAGAAKSNITPFLGGGIIGGWGTPEATHVHDELHARCLVLDDGTTKLVFIVADVLGLRRDLIDEAKSRINKITNIPTENIMISVTHTHSATSAMGVGDQRRQWSRDRTFDDYQIFLLNRFSDVVMIALNNMEPARIGWGIGSVPQHVFVRRWKMKPGTPIPNPFGSQDKVVMNPGVGNPNLLEPAGKPDPDVSFISVQSLDGKPLAVLANYSLHYVGGVPQGHISADYFGIFADRLQELLQADRQNPPFVGIMSNGTSGDVNNINFRGPAEKNQPYAKMRIVADDVAKEVFRVYKTIRHQDWVPLRAAMEELTLNVRKPDQELIARAENVLKRPDSVQPVHRHENVYAERTLYLKEWPDQVDIVLQVFGIGDLGVAAIPFETFSETGLEIKSKSPFKTTFTIELANGYYGYLPTPEQHELGGYETWLGTCNVEKQASVKIVAKLLGLFGRIKGIGSH